LKEKFAGIKVHFDEREGEYASKCEIQRELQNSLSLAPFSLCSLL